MLFGSVDGGGNDGVHVTERAGGEVVGCRSARDGEEDVVGSIDGVCVGSQSLCVAACFELCLLLLEELLLTLLLFLLLLLLEFLVELGGGGQLLEGLVGMLVVGHAERGGLGADATRHEDVGQVRTAEASS